MCYHCQGQDNETPAEFLSHKLKLCRKILPLTEAMVEDYAYEVINLWMHTPHEWAAHINTQDCATAADLIKLAADRNKQLQASSLSNLRNLSEVSSSSRVGPQATLNNPSMHT